MCMVAGPPRLRDDFMVRIMEGINNVPVNLSQDPAPFPLDMIAFTWSRDGQPLTTGPSGPALTYSTVTFATIEREDAGNYTVVATNSVQDEQVGIDTGSFYLDVICKIYICVSGLGMGSIDIDSDLKSHNVVHTKN